VDDGLQVSVQITVSDQFADGVCDCIPVTLIANPLMREGPGLVPREARWTAASRPFAEVIVGQPSAPIGSARSLPRRPPQPLRLQTARRAVDTRTGRLENQRLPAGAIR
jgi:hypothetical protein